MSLSVYSVGSTDCYTAWNIRMVNEMQEYVSACVEAGCNLGSLLGSLLDTGCWTLLLADVLILFLDTVAGHSLVIAVAGRLLDFV